MRIFIFLFLSLFFVVNLQAQDFEITFTASGESAIVEDVKLVYLSKGDTIDMPGTDVLKLVRGSSHIHSSLNAENGVLFYPNPMVEEGRFEFSTRISGPCNLEVYDISGKLVIRGIYELHAGKQTFSLSGLNTGLYILRASTPEKNLSARIVSVGKNPGLPFLRYENSELSAKEPGNLKGSQSVVEVQYTDGDWLLLKGISGDHKRIITIVPERSRNINFEFFSCKDYDDNHYPVTAIGNQLWMAENLRTSRFDDGLPITHIVSDSVWSKTTTPGYCRVNNDEENFGHLGKLYNWFATGISGNPCPDGWHVPDYDEYMEMHQYLIDNGYNYDGSTELNKAGKALSHSMYWKGFPTLDGAVGNNPLLNNTTGFSMLPAGRRNHDDGEFVLSSTHSMNWLSTTESGNANNANYFMTAWDSPLHETLTANKNSGFAIRCISKEPAIYAGIKPWDENPNYWQYRGKPILLFGGSDRDNIYQWAGDGTRLTDHLDTLQNSGGNYIRCTMNSREYTPEGYRWDSLPYPYKKVNDKYDLTQWDEVYWNKLRTFLYETQERGIIVQLELMDRWNEKQNLPHQRKLGWDFSPFNPDNNINYETEDSPLLTKDNTDFYHLFHFAAVVNDSLLLPIQQRFIEKIIDEVIDNGFNHVIFQVDNESGIGNASLEPDPYWANYIREYGRSKNKNHPIYVCTSRRFHFPTPYLTTNWQDWNNPEIRVPILNEAFNFCDIAQNNGNSGQLHYDNLIWYRSKVHEHGVRPVNHVKCYHFNWPTGANFNTGRSSPTDEEAFSKFWRAVFGGAASIRFHRHTPLLTGGLREGYGLTPEAQVHIRSMRMLINEIDIYRTEPDNGLLSGRTSNEAYCLAEPGKQYAVFFTGEGDRSVIIDFKSDSITLSQRWLDISNNTWHDLNSVNGSNNFTLSPPGEGHHWVAVLKNIND